MASEEIIQSAVNLLQHWAIEITQPEAGRVDVTLPAEKIAYVVAVIIEKGTWHLSAITGLDIPQTQHTDGEIELLYHFCHKEVVLTLRIKTPYGSPIVPSICKIIPSAVLYEKEAVEMFGVIMEGIPMRDLLLLPDDWPDWVYPLRKSFTGLQ